MAREAGEKAREETTRIVGLAIREGRPVAAGGRVSAWQKPRAERSRANPAMLRGRAVPDGGYEVGWTCVGPDGRFAVEGLKNYPGYEPWFLVYEGPDGACTQVGPIRFTSMDREVRADIRVVESGAIEGRVEHVPAAMAGRVWVVAFDAGVIRREVLAKPDGSFQIEDLPPGRYGLKPGHDAYRDPHVPRVEELRNLDRALLRKKAEPWQGAVVATVESGKTAGGVVLDLRPPGPIVDPADRAK